MAQTVIVTRFEGTPASEPQHYVVGFSVQLDNGREFYLEALVSLSEAAGKTDQQIAEMAYASLSKDIEMRVAELGKRSALLGKVFETEEMRAERVKAEEEQAKNLAKAVKAATDRNAESAAITVTENQAPEEFPGGRLTEENAPSDEERNSDSDSAGDPPRKRRRVTRTSSV